MVAMVMAVPMFVYGGGFGNCAMLLGPFFISSIQSHSTINTPSYACGWFYTFVLCMRLSTCECWLREWVHLCVHSINIQVNKCIQDILHFTNAPCVSAFLSQFILIAKFQTFIDFLLDWLSSWKLCPISLNSNLETISVFI